MSRQRNNRQRAIVALLRISKIEAGVDNGGLARRRGDTLHLSLNGLIGPDKGIRAKQVIAALNANPTASFIDLEINSEGGSCKEAFDIHAALKNHGSYVVTRANDVCLSAATVVLAAGDHREAYSGTRLLLHRSELVPETQARWTAATHSARSRSLQRTDSKMLDIYETAAGGNRMLFERYMQSETNLPLSIAKAWGLINCLAGEAMWLAGRPRSW